MEWCDHCCRFCQTRLETIVNHISDTYCSSCTMCGKVLLDLSTPLQIIYPDDRNSTRIKDKKKNNVKNVKKEFDAASKGLSIEALKQPMHSDTTQVSDNC